MPGSKSRNQKKRHAKIRPKSSNPGEVNNWQTTGDVMRKVILLLAFVSSGAMAETHRLVPNAQVNYYGIGANTCAQYLDDRKKDRNSSGVRSAFYTAWLKGYVSGSINSPANRLKCSWSLPGY